MNRFTLHQVIGYRLKVKVVQSILYLTPLTQYLQIRKELHNVATQ